MDDEDAKRALCHTWSYKPPHAPMTSIAGAGVGLGAFILGDARRKRQPIRHLNGDRLDFRRSNIYAGPIRSDLPMPPAPVDVKVIQPEGRIVGMIPIRSRRNGIIAYARVDDCDDEMARRVSWSLSHGYAASRSSDGRALKLHRLVMGEPPADGMVVDHINGDRLDNRRGNLRWLTHNENLHNTDSTWARSGHRGAMWESQTNGWRAVLKVKGKVVHSSRHKSLDEAVAARAKAVREHLPWVNGDGKT